MDWLKSLTSTSKKSHRKSSSSHRRSSDKRFYVRTQDKRIVTAYKNPSGGFVYHKRSSSGVRNVPIQGHTYKTEKEAKAKVERLKKK